MTSRFPKVNLAIDNCFASKRWTEPSEWMSVIRDLGLTFVESSADTECDPLYHGADYLRRWKDAVQEAAVQTGCVVANLYSGHGTYATLGLAHTDEEIRRRFVERWIKPAIDVADDLSAGLGFFMHAFPISVLDDAEAYERALLDLTTDLTEIAAYTAGRDNVAPVGLEQMYTPHQVPWTVAGTRSLLAEVAHRAGAPLYVTIDVGHQSGQHRFLRPTAGAVADALSRLPASTDIPWLGTTRAHALFQTARREGRSDAATVDAIVADIDTHPYLFAAPSDGDPYHWLEELSGWSPIIHLQQTDGTSSRHWPFTTEHNKGGIIDPAKVLDSIYRHYSRDADDTMPPRVDTIALTLEIFSSTADRPGDIIARLQETVAYWRRFVREDGLTIDVLVDKST